MTIEILRIHEDNVTKAMFTLTEWLASSGLILVAPIFETDKTNVKGRTECLFEVFEVFPSIALRIPTAHNFTRD